ncbi:hypothetical protein ANACOL_04241 [Anaerotruncus colihominis DSM 17241]|uniref:Uncharacterized protein n=1 Tax=Anaerotruncus colihominis DSM 17241 TaxID=445972 RepID=B0PHE8_9FIRM|nr:hypothetical protein ANACOL_04241 [Anaerotruncus colihominis DSM 17241]
MERAAWLPAPVKIILERKVTICPHPVPYICGDFRLLSCGAKK